MYQAAVRANIIEASGTPTLPLEKKSSIRNHGLFSQLETPKKLGRLRGPFMLLLLLTN